MKLDKLSEIYLYIIVKLKLIEILNAIQTNWASVSRQWKLPYVTKNVWNMVPDSANLLRQCQAKTKRQENVGKQMNKYAHQLAIE